ncbi:MAG: hypothetical protein AAGC92_02550 [Pseudomonadota bacterium]
MGCSILEVSERPTALEGVTVSQVDVTARKRAEAAARQSEAMLSTILEGSPYNLCMSHIGSGTVIYRAPARADLLGKNISAKERFAYMADRADFRIELLPTGRVDGLAADTRKADGSILPTLFSARLIELRGVDVMVASVTDLGLQLKAHQALARQALARQALARQALVRQALARQALTRSTRRLHDAIVTLDQGFAPCDQNARLVMWNRRHAEPDEDMCAQIRKGARYQDVLKVAAVSGRLPEVAFQNRADEGLHDNTAARYEFGKADAWIGAIVEACPAILVMDRFSDSEVIDRTKTASASFGKHEGVENFWRDQDMRRFIATEP